MRRWRKTLGQLKRAKLETQASPWGRNGGSIIARAAKNRAYRKRQSAWDASAKRAFKPRPLTEAPKCERPWKSEARGCDLLVRRPRMQRRMGRYERSNASARPVTIHRNNTGKPDGAVEARAERQSEGVDPRALATVWALSSLKLWKPTSTSSGLKPSLS